MAIFKKLLRLFEENKVKYNLVPHKTVFTALDKAATLGVKPAQIAKTLAVSVDREYAIVVVPANRNLDFNVLKKVISVIRKKLKQKLVQKVAIVKEKWIEKNIKGVKPGAVPPFGALWKLPTFVDKALLKEKSIIVNGGNNEESIKITSKNLLKIMPDAIAGNFSKAK